ncbi:MAG: methyltransferase domain-containing protein [Candidatus Solibacter usitatus]|nr:methyltransferase domain-containing protein [Candidatus Solibacter usitatus]
MIRLLLLSTLSTLLLSGQAADKANERYRTPEGRQGMLGNLGASDRAERIHAQAIVQALDLKPGMAAADLGTGAGALLPALSAAVGPSGKVFAEDIFQDFLDSSRTKNFTLANVAWILGTERDPKLPASSIDAAATVDAYHHWDYPAEMLANLRRALKPGGRFAVADYYRRAGAMGPGPDALEHIRIDRDEVIKEVEAAGFKLLTTSDTAPGKQYIAVFTR